MCHQCLNLNESDSGEVLKCEKCGKAFLPVNYFDKIRRRAIEAGQLPQNMPEIALHSLNGLLVFW